jgi:hypothetical protein
MILPVLNQASSKRIACPICGEFGKGIELFTVRSLVKEMFVAAIREDVYFFCADPDCEVVYYSFCKDVIKKYQIKTRVGLKEKETPRPVCYCFGHTMEDIQDEIQQKGRSTALKDIFDKIQAGLCHCEDANPEGRCCLGNVTIAVRKAFCLYTKQESLDALKKSY